MRPCVQALVAAGTRARFALQARLNSIPGLTLALKLTLFKNLVLPALTYGCQIWGVEYLTLPTGVLTPTSGNSTPDSPFEDVWLQYLRVVCGVGRFVPRWCLLQECGFDFMQLHFAKCTVRFWNALRNPTMAHNSTTVAMHDVRLMVQGNRHCWSYKLCSFLHRLGYPLDASVCSLFDAAQHPPGSFDTEQALQYFWQLDIQVDDVVEKLKIFWTERVLLHVRGMDPRHPTTPFPRLCQYTEWSGRPCGVQRYHAYMYQPLPARHLLPFMRFRLGAWMELDVHADVLRHGSRRRRRALAIPIAHSCCCCNAPVLQDELHVVFECPRLANLRAQFPRLFTQRVVADKNLRALLQSSEFSSVTHFIALAYEWLLRCRTPL